VGRCFKQFELELEPLHRFSVTTACGVHLNIPLSAVDCGSAALQVAWWGP
jgi:hypothetical protein